MYGTYPSGDSPQARFNGQNKGGYVRYIPLGMLLIDRPLGAESARVCTVHTPSSLNSHSNKRSRKSASFRSLDADKPPALMRTEIAPLASLSNEATTFPFTLNTLGGS